MEREKRDQPQGGDDEHRRRGEDSRREMDEVPEPGTDPLHEGP